MSMAIGDEREATNIGVEFQGAAGLGDRRLEARLVAVAERIRAAPEESFPDIMGSEAELTGLYRLLNNGAVSLGTILEPHQQQTATRCAESGRVLVLHDTTEAKFSGVAKRRGLGRLRSPRDQGLLLHLALAVAADGSRRPLGVLDVHCWVREELGSARDADGRRRNGDAYSDIADKESNRWWDLIDRAENRLGGVEAIHVFDREGDSYVLLHTALENDARFVARMARDRVVLDEDGDRIGHTSEALLDIVSVITLEVSLSPRAAKKTPRVTDEPRLARSARLAVGATRMHLAPPNYIDGTPESLAVNVVYVGEVDAPPDVEPIGWVLITTEPIDTLEQISAVVEAYRTRWLIEEFFRALKSGCALEKRQLESYESITAALGIFLPIAWQLLLLRNLARTQPNESAELVLTPTQIDVLRAAVPKLARVEHPTVAEALRAVAYLGGHFIKRDPGWIVLGRGLEKLLDLELGWQLAKRCDRT